MTNFHQRMYATRAFYLLSLFALFAACAQFGVPSPKNTEQNIAYTYAGFTAAYKTVGDLRMQNSITSAQRDDAIKQLDLGSDALGIARAAWTTGNVTGTETGLKQAQSILLALQSVLQSYANKGKQ